MELQSATMMRKLVDRLDHYPELRGRIQRHIQETEQQAARLESCIERRGEKTSTLKDVAGKMTATVQGLSGTVAADEVVKAHLAHYTFEHYGIASYRILMATADEADRQRVVQGTSGAVRVDLGGCRPIKKNNHIDTYQ